jgi:hypothetical protein
VAVSLAALSLRRRRLRLVLASEWLPAVGSMRVLRVSLTILGYVVDCEAATTTGIDMTKKRGYAAVGDVELRWKGLFDND